MSDVTFVVVQHGEKVAGRADPGLTVTGQRQAFACASVLTNAHAVAIYSSPLRRAVETASPIGDALGMPVMVDDGLRERMDWSPAADMSIEEFLADWDRATIDREYQPNVGDSSKTAGARFEGALQRFAFLHSDGTVVCVAHGGVTVDLLRDLLGDEELATRAPTVIAGGMPAGALTTIRLASGAWSVVDIAALDHLCEADRADHRAC